MPLKNSIELLRFLCYYCNIQRTPHSNYDITSGFFAIADYYD